VLTALVAVVATGAGAANEASASPFAFQPISIQRINVPSTAPGPQWPAFTKDGQHLLFWSGGNLWITDLHGQGSIA
jgi:hypothetical protein